MKNLSLWISSVFLEYLGCFILRTLIMKNNPKTFRTVCNNTYSNDHSVSQWLSCTWLFKSWENQARNAIHIKFHNTILQRSHRTALFLKTTTWLPCACKRFSIIHQNREFRNRPTKYIPDNIIVHLFTKYFPVALHFTSISVRSRNFSFAEIKLSCSENVAYSR